MKKALLIIPFAVLMLCGCGKADNSSNVSEISDAEVEVTTSDENVCDWADNRIEYKTLDEFTAACAEKEPAFYSNKRINYNSPLILKFDETKYELTSIYSDQAGYEYYLGEKDAYNKTVRISVCNNTDAKEIDDVYRTFGNKYSTITTAETGGKEYDIMVWCSEYGTEKNYSITYVPAENHRATISVGANSTAEEILEYFDDFELVPAE